MSKSPDETEFGEVRGLLRRLESAALAPSEGSAQDVASYRGNPNSSPERSRGPSAAAVLVLIANTAMATAAITAIVFYLLNPDARQRGVHATDKASNEQAISAQMPSSTQPAPPQPTAPPQAAFAPVAAEKKSEPAVVAPTKSAATGPAVPDQARDAAGGSPAAPSVVAPTEIQVGENEHVPMRVRLEPADTAHMITSLIFRGLPGDVALTQGSASDAGMWIVPANAITELELAAGKGAIGGRFDIVISARLEDGGEISAAHSTLVITPSPPSVETPSVVAPTPLDAEAQARLLGTGRNLLDMGQIGAARMVLEKAVNGGNAEAAVLLGDTYDSARLLQLGAQGIPGDAGKATYWYERADEMGAPDAKARIIELGR